MAAEYTLNLKAVLDTTDVQNKLNQLRNQQQKMVNQSGSTASPNLGGLNGVLNRLNTTLTQLNRAISQLTGGNIRQTNGRGFNGPMMFNANKPISPVGVASELYSTLARTAQQFVTSEMSGYKHGLTHGAYTPAQFNTLTGNLNKWYMGQMGEAKAMFYGTLNEERQYRNQQLPNGSPKANGSRGRGWANMFGGENRGVMRFAGGMIAHQVMGSAQDYFEQTGNKTGSVLMGMGQYAAMGGMVGGLPGAAIGLAAGGVSEAFKYLTEKTKELSDAMSNQLKRVSSSATVTTSLEDQEIERRARLGDKNFFKSRLSEGNKRIEELKNWNALNVGDKYNSLEEYEKDTQAIMDVAMNSGTYDADMKAQIQKRNQTADQYKKNIQELERLQRITSFSESTLNGMGIFQGDAATTNDLRKGIGGYEKSQLKGLRTIAKQEIKSLEKQKSDMFSSGQGLDVIEEVQKKLDDFKDRLEIVNVELDRRAKVERDIRKEQKRETLRNLQDRLAGMSGPDMSQVNSLASQGFAISRKDDDIRWTSQINYMAEQTRLQRLIKQKMDNLNIEDTTTFQ